MDWDKLYEMQENLDTYIEENHQVEKHVIFSKKFLALLVELGELANETRCFKFWSNKGPGKNQAILEEYVDVLHFMLSLGLEKGYRYKGENGLPQLPDEDVNTLFINLFEACTKFGNASTDIQYHNMFHSFLVLGSALGFQSDMIEKKYFEKNTTNYRRQDEGY